MSRIYKIFKIFGIRETGLQVRKDLNVYRCQLSQGEKVHRTLMSIDAPSL